MIFRRLSHHVREQNWTAIAIDFVIVGLGVLLGMQASNWNETRKTEHDVRALVQNVRAEFVINRASLEAARANLDTVMAMNQRLLSLVGLPETGMSDAELDSLIELTFFRPRWIPVIAASQELLNSGGLSVLDDDGVKPLLFEFERQLRAIDDRYRELEHSSDDVIDYVKEHGSLRNMNHRRISVERSRLPVGNRHLLSDPRFENRVDRKLVMTLFLSHQYRQIDEVIDAILRETDRSGTPEHRGAP